MKTNLILIVAVVLAMVSGSASAGQVPHEAGGFTLGEPIDRYQDRVRLDTSLPIRYMEYIREVEIEPNPAFKTGLIGYGDCDVPGRIVWIKLKYADSSMAFFEKLLSRFKETFGEPDEWQGDPFGVVKEWKWAFTDERNHRITLLLHHNVMDDEEKKGNAIKLTDRTLEALESQCHQKKHPGKIRPAAPSSAPTAPQNWEQLIPR